jgi:hypothetical protein
MLRMDLLSMRLLPRLKTRGSNTPNFLGKFFKNNGVSLLINVCGSCYHRPMNEKQLKALMAQIVRANSAKLEAEKKDNETITK